MKNISKNFWGTVLLVVVMVVFTIGLLFFLVNTKPIEISQDKITVLTSGQEIDVPKGMKIMGDALEVLKADGASDDIDYLDTPFVTTKKNITVKCDKGHSAVVIYPADKEEEFGATASKILSETRAKQ